MAHNDRYFIARLTGQEGPLSYEQVRVGLRNGRYSGREMSWSEQQAGEWLRLDERPEFSSLPLTDAEIDELPAFKAEPRPAPAPPPTASPAPLDIDLRALSRVQPGQLSAEQVELVRRAGIAWRRFLARHLDLAICLAVLVLVWQPQSPQAMLASFDLLALLSVALWPWLEAVLLTTVGNTPGKALLKLRLLREDGGRPDFGTALKRSLLVWIRGIGLGLPIVKLIACVLAFNDYTRNGRSAWDIHSGTQVIADPISHARMGIIVGLFITSAVLSAMQLMGLQSG